MAKHKVSELEGALLDAAVAMCEGAKVLPGRLVWPGDESMLFPRRFLPSEDWSDAGPIIERERISLENRCHPWDGKFGSGWMAYVHDDPVRIVTLGATALEAAMRYYVTKKLGKEIEIP